jgi:hypothetical protein
MSFFNRIIKLIGFSEPHQVNKHGSQIFLTYLEMLASPKHSFFMLGKNDSTR